jgi:hypothetical protein
MFFFEKKNQKTSAPLRAVLKPPGAKVFCGAFLQKSDRLLPSFVNSLCKTRALRHNTRVLTRTQERAGASHPPPKAQPAPGNAQAKGLRSPTGCSGKPMAHVIAPTGSRAGFTPARISQVPKTEGGQPVRRFSRALIGVAWGYFA